MRKSRQIYFAGPQQYDRHTENEIIAHCRCLYGQNAAHITGGGCCGKFTFASSSSMVSIIQSLVQSSICGTKSADRVIVVVPLGMARLGSMDHSSSTAASSSVLEQVLAASLIDLLPGCLNCSLTYFRISPLLSQAHASSTTACWAAAAAAWSPATTALPFAPSTTLQRFRAATAWSTPAALRAPCARCAPCS